MTTFVDDATRRRLFPDDGASPPGAAFPRAAGTGDGDVDVGGDGGWWRPLLLATGAALLVLVPLHVVGLLLDPELDAGTLVGRWQHTGWLFVDWALLVVGALHGTVAVGLRVGRRAWSPTLRITLVVGLATFVGVLTAWASWAMLQLV